MSIILSQYLCWTLLMLDKINSQSMNQPEICSSATWNPNGLTFADQSIIGDYPTTVVVDTNDSIYIVATNASQVQIWRPTDVAPNKIISNGLIKPYGLFISNNGDIYIDNGGSVGQIEKWTWNDTNGIPVMNVSESCYSLFIDNNNTVYCSLKNLHQVVKTTSNNVGTGTSGSASNMLNEPHGIFVDNKLNLYVADSGNNRIQRFSPGQSNGITIAAGTGSSIVVTLNYPTAIIVDTNGNLFIADMNNDRIIRTDSTGFRCIVGCTGISGSSSNQLNNPSSLSFDSAGNLFVVDLNNNRIQKFLLATNSCGPSYNRPKLCASAIWDSSATTFADSTFVGVRPFSVFVDINNTVYVAARTSHSIQIWLKDATSPSTALFSNLVQPHSVFVTINEDIYVDNGFARNRIDQLTKNATTSTITMYVNGTCHGIFLDIYDRVYCSLGDFHQVIKRISNDNETMLTIVAGTGVSGSASDMLDTPQGIFVSLEFSLYIADSANNRIQHFLPMQSNGSTVAGNGAPDTIILDYPTGVILDDQSYLFIVDSNNNRIVGSSPNGFRCIVGCSTGSGSAANQLKYPWSLSFDSLGNLFIADSYNNRIQKFTLSMNSCGRSYNLPNFCTHATWNPVAITFADNTTVGSYPSDIFISINNTIYITATNLNQAQIWLVGSITPTKIISIGLNSPYAIFTSIIDSIYIDNGVLNNRVDKWMTNETVSVVEMYSNASCYDLFTDTYDNLYCSINTLHIVIKKIFSHDAFTSTIVAGNGINGSDAYMLNGPRGIFVDTKFNLYVADCGNNRIQMFQLDQLNGSTVMENLPGENITLNCPSAVILDENGYLFVTDYNNHRIIATGPDGFRCIVGCSGYGGSSGNELYYPRSLSFDNDGNIYVTDTGNQRIQMFALATNSCYEITTVQYMVTSVMSTDEQLETFAVGTTGLITSSTLSSLPSEAFIAPSCSNTTLIGTNCNISFNPCDLLDPCQNDGTCFNDNTALWGFICLCPPDVDGIECENDYRICQSDICWNNGTCLETSNSTYFCACADGWQNVHCELLINYCLNVTCLNRGVCRPLLLDFKCECLGDSYSGRFCEITSSRIQTLQAVAKSFAFIAILIIIAVVTFIVIMDILTYCFGIDLTKAERELIRKKKYMKKRTKKQVVPRQNESLRLSSIRLSQRSVSIVERTI